MNCFFINLCKHYYHCGSNFGILEDLLGLFEIKKTLDLLTILFFAKKFVHLLDRYLQKFHFSFNADKSELLRGAVSVIEEELITGLDVPLSKNPYAMVAIDL